MNDKEFDNLLKKQIQEDKYVPKKINQLFSNFEMEVNMKKNESENNLFRKYLKTASIAAALIVVVFIGGSTYAHINGSETLISPLLRKLGINSKYEENKTEFSEQQNEQNITIKMLDGAIDDTALIVGYEIEIKDNNPDNWIEVVGDYKINNISTQPINYTLDKISDTSYVYYQVFDVSEIEIQDKENVKISAIINQIKEYTESESLNSVEAVYGNTHNIDLNLQESISVKNLEESKVYEFANSKKYEILNNVNLSISNFVTGSYTNILKINTDQSNYSGDAFEKYYKVFDEQNNEIATFSEEEKQYDYNQYNDRLVLSDVDKDSKIIIEVYLKMIDDSTFNKVASIPVDLSTATEKVETNANYKQYNNQKYSFNYNENWHLFETVTADRVGPNSAYLGALELEIPSTTNSEYSSSIYVRTINQNYTLSEYKSQIENENTSSPSEYYEEVSSSEVHLKNCNGYQITASSTDGETNYIKQDIFTIENGTVYRITFFGSEKDFNNLSSDIEEFVNNFEVL